MKPVSIVMALVSVALMAGIIWILGPGARWVLEYVDEVAIGGPAGLAGEDLAAALDAVRGRVLAVTTGLAALVAVFYTARNADTARRTFQLGERGVVTDRYGKAVEQLGNAQAPVRLGGLHALEQLAQDNPDPALRQTVVDVICAYLRMPYTPPAEQDRHMKIRAAQRVARVHAASPDTGRGRDPHEEFQVRLTAQRVLAEHLRYQDPPARRWWRPRGVDLNVRHWPGIRLDLTGATLIDFNLYGCHVTDAVFGEATFTGGARFGRTTFTGDAEFSGATFTSGAGFNSVTFTSGAGFGRATFTGDAWFEGATFTGYAAFHGGTFTGVARFDAATFTDHAGFGGATFIGDAWFTGATFTGHASFYEATFTGGAMFDGATGLRRSPLDGASVAPEAAIMRPCPPAPKP